MTEHVHVCARRVAIVGCRPPTRGAPGAYRANLALYEAIVTDVRRFVQDLCCTSVIVSGGAEGVDSVAVEANGWRCEVVEHLPVYPHRERGRCGCPACRAAPLARNTLIVADCDELHAWPASWSRGTHDTIRKARPAGKPTHVHEVRP